MVSSRGRARRRRYREPARPVPTARLSGYRTSLEPATQPGLQSSGPPEGLDGPQDWEGHRLAVERGVAWTSLDVVIGLRLEGARPLNPPRLAAVRLQPGSEVDHTY
eukprot:768421-Hanusia_phi.AAC.3